MTFKERILFVVVSWGWWQRYAVTILFLVLLMSCWWFLSYRHMIHALRSMHAQEALIQQNIPQEQAAVQPIELQQQSVEEVFAQRKRAFFVVDSFGECSDAVFALAKRENLGCEKNNLVREEIKDWYKQCELQLVLVGPLGNMINFFERLQKYDNVLVQKAEFTLQGSEEDACITRCQVNLLLFVQSS